VAVEQAGQGHATTEQQAGSATTAMFKLGKLAMWHNGICSYRHEGRAFSGTSSSSRPAR